ncbi:hypothetical protein F5I97DRAFT_398180 [Phlebopus sp. FC_14]|nr:hypothetical protein F5I97DRAFT_398180 [Phlebopus sp. FC_14]
MLNEQSHKSEPTTKVDNEQATGTNVSYSQPPHPVAEIISCAQRGDLATIQRLVDSGKATVNDRDDQNVYHTSPLGSHKCPARHLSLPHRPRRRSRRDRRRSPSDALTMGRAERLPLRCAPPHIPQRRSDDQRYPGVQRPPPRHALVFRHAVAVSATPTHQRRLARLAGPHVAHVGGVPGRCALGGLVAETRRESELEGRYGLDAVALGGCEGK